MTHEHCWHKLSTAQMSAPPKFQFICCHCGVAIYAHERLIHPAGHGNFAPLVATGQPILPPQQKRESDGQSH